MSFDFSFEGTFGVVMTVYLRLFLVFTWCINGTASVSDFFDWVIEEVVSIEFVRIGDWYVGESSVSSSIYVYSNYCHDARVWWIDSRVRFQSNLFFSGEHLNFIAQGQRPKKSFYNALAALTVASQRFLYLWKIPTPTVLAVVCTLVLNRVLTIAQLKKQLQNCFLTGCSVLCLQGLDANHLSIHCLLLP